MFFGRFAPFSNWPSQRKKKSSSYYYFGALARSRVIQKYIICLLLWRASARSHALAPNENHSQNANENHSHLEVQKKGESGKNRPRLIPSSLLIIRNLKYILLVSHNAPFLFLHLQNLKKNRLKYFNITIRAICLVIFQ